jgi:hypothetical protein
MWRIGGTCGACDQLRGKSNGKQNKGTAVGSLAKAVAMLVWVACLGGVAQPLGNVGPRAVGRVGSTYGRQCYSVRGT